MIHSMTAYARREIKGDWGTGRGKFVQLTNGTLKPLFAHLSNFVVWSR